MPKLQSAMEYLTTYGWAILIIGLAIAVLFELISGATSNPTQVCSPPAGFSCPTFFMSQNGLLQFNLLQATQSPISITALGCGNSQAVALSRMDYTPMLTTPPSGNQLDTFPITMPANVPIGANETFSVQCYSNNTAYFGQINNVYSGYVTVNYTNAYTQFPNTIYGKVVVKVSK